MIKEEIHVVPPFVSVEPKKRLGSARRVQRQDSGDKEGLNTLQSLKDAPEPNQNPERYAIQDPKGRLTELAKHNGNSDSPNFVSRRNKIHTPLV